MNKKFLKTVATIASASMVVLSAATCFAADVTTTTKSEFDFSTGDVKVTTVASGVTAGDMVTYLLADTNNVAKGADILYIDQQTAKGADVTFACTVDISKLESVAGVLKLGSNAGHNFGEVSDEGLDVVASDATVHAVQTITNVSGEFTVVAKANVGDDDKYGARFTVGDKYYDIYAVSATDTDADAVGKADLADGKYFAITVTGFDGDFADCTLVPFVDANGTITLAQ